MQPDFGLSIFTLVVLILSIIIHEVAHGYAAYALGDPTAKHAGRLTLNPAPHIDIFGSVLVPLFLVITHAGFMFGWAKPVPYNPNNLNRNAFARRFGESVVAAAGVTTNLLIAVLFAFVARAAFGSGQEVFGSLSATVCLVNLFLGFFNLIPIPPLDGYTFLRGLIPYRSSMAFRNFEDRLRAGGVATLFIFLIFFTYVLSAPFYAFVQYVFNALIGT